MTEPATVVASVVQQTGLQDVAKAITIDRPLACGQQAQVTPRCQELAAANARQQVLADVAAIGVALFVAALVGRIAVTFVKVFGICLRYHRTRMKVRASAARRPPHGGLFDG
ncbi:MULTISPECIES: hypothetical protein [unclassified Novosphingobium]|uniref:hypothetical protein n=1 Tax=unclassified Novosphingobium TaxID=2644732 RepID=UPI00135CDBD1|nr:MULTISPECIES: hypothetical protein [unclassified Novosphingobium]